MTDRLRVLLSAPYMIPVHDRFSPLFDEFGVDLLVATVRERLSEAELLGYVSDVDGAICGDDGFTAAILEAFAPRLKVVSKWGTGIDSIDRQAASRTSNAARASVPVTDGSRCPLMASTNSCNWANLAASPSPIFSATVCSPRKSSC